MSIHPSDWERILIELNARATRVIPIIESARRGLSDAAAGIQRVAFLDDGHEDDDPKGPPVLPRPDEARKAKSELAAALAQADSHMRRVEALALEYRRLGLPHDHPDKAPTKEERLASEGESIDDDKLCISCARKNGQNLRIGGSKLCGWCRGIVLEYGPVVEGKDPGSGPRWPQMTMPPIELVSDHLESQMGRQKLTTPEVERRLRLWGGSPSYAHTRKAS